VSQIPFTYQNTKIHSKQLYESERNMVQPLMTYLMKDNSFQFTFKPLVGNHDSYGNGNGVDTLVMQYDTSVDTSVDT